MKKPLPIHTPNLLLTSNCCESRTLLLLLKLWQITRTLFEKIIRNRAFTSTNCWCILWKWTYFAPISENTGKFISVAIFKLNIAPISQCFALISTKIGANSGWVITLMGEILIIFYGRGTPPWKIQLKD